MSDAPERIWVKTHGDDRQSGYWQDKPILPNMPENIGIEYRRADLPPTLAQAMTVPEVRELVEAVAAEIKSRNLYLSTAPDRGGMHGTKGQRKAALDVAQSRTVAALNRIGETK